MAKVLVVGSGGREHAIVFAIAKSKHVSQIYAAPGNAGMTRHATCISLKETELEALADFAFDNKIDVTIVGPEASLALGIVDVFHARGLQIFGPTKAASRIEASKKFAKSLMEKYEIPTARYQSFQVYEEAFAYIKTNNFPIVLKYDGLAAGKGVIIAYNLEEADQALKDMLLDERYGSGSVVIEEFLEGTEFSFMCFVDGKDVYPLEMAQDHKRAFDGDLGPNTGGMGAYSPLPFISPEDQEYALKQIMIPTAQAMLTEGFPFTGVLYGGLIKTSMGIKVIEFNCRFGDPETEVVLPRLKSDLYEAIVATINHKTPILEWGEFSTIGIVLASKGYPNAYEKGYVIEGADQENIYHMGTKFNENGEYVTNGGRVLFAVAEGESFVEANQKALALVDTIHCENLFHRRDIGKKVLEK